MNNTTHFAANINRSAGAINNALKRMAAAGQVHQVDDQPRRYQLAQATKNSDSQKPKGENKVQLIVLCQESK